MKTLVMLVLLLSVSAPVHAQTEAEEPVPDANIDAQPSAEPDAPPSAEPDGGAPSTTASGALGLLTLAGAVGTVVGVGVWVERDGSLDACERYAMEDPPTLGCLNAGSIRDQRDVGIGLTIGFGALTLGAAIAWAIVVATMASEPEQAAFTCGPGLLSFACAGTF